MPPENGYAIADARRPGRKNSGWAHGCLMPGPCRPHVLPEVEFTVLASWAPHRPDLGTWDSIRFAERTPRLRYSWFP